VIKAMAASNPATDQRMATEVLTVEDEAERTVAATAV
jgi:hypothetical protein